MKTFKGHVRFSWLQIMGGKVLPLGLVLGAVMFAAGCGQKESPAPPATTPTAATATNTDEAAQQTTTPDESTPATPTPESAGPQRPKVDAAAAATSEADLPILQQMNRAMLRYRIQNHKNPGSVEELASYAGIQLPPAPPGKKYSITSRGFVVLSDN